MGFCEHGSFIGRTTPGIPSLCNATDFKFKQFKGSKATVSNLTEQFFKAYNANDMQRVRQYVTSDIVYIEMEVKTRFVLLSRLGTTEPGDFAF